MTETSRLLLRLARWIAGPARAEWIDAMEAEAASAGGESTPWAIGCLGAALKDRLAHDAWFVLVVLILSISAILWKEKIFFATSDLLVHQRISPSFAVAIWVISPLPLAFLFGLIRPKRSTYVLIVATYLLVEFAPLLLLWIAAGVSPLEFFSAAQVNWYKADPNVRLGPVAGLTCDLLVWLSGTWLGMRSRRLASGPAASD